MIYVTLRSNDTGQLMVGCPHIPKDRLEIQMVMFPDGSAHYQVSCLGHFWFAPSKQTIVVWCNDCYLNLGVQQRMLGHAEEMERRGGGGPLSDPGRIH